MNDIFDSNLYLNRFEKKLKDKVGLHFTKKGIMQFFDETRWQDDDPEKMEKVAKNWETKIDSELFSFKYQKKGCRIQEQ